jgi:hypothetical protein
MQADRISEEQIADYCLDGMPAEERARFEAKMAVDADLMAKVSSTLDALHSSANRGPVGPERTDIWEQISRRIAAETSASQTSQDTAVGLPWSWIWGIAALLLLGLNLLTWVNRPPFSIPDSSGVATSGSGVEGTPLVVENEPSRGALLAEIKRLNVELEATANGLNGTERALDDSRTEAAEIAEDREQLQQQLEYLAARFAPFFQPGEGMSRFTVIEMVDAVAFAEDTPRKGFADLAGRFLTGGTGLSATTEPIMGPVVEGAGVASAVSEGIATGFAPIARGDAPLAAPSTSAEVPVGEVFEGEAAGFSVWRDDEQKGFLDIYNLPEAEPGRQAYLWVRASELEDYIPVGVLPELLDGTGSVFFEVDEADFTPTEILITAEPDGIEDPQVPSDDILLRGP